MSKLSMKKLIESSSLPASLIRSTVKQFGDWDNFRDDAPDIVNHGADCGFSGFTNYSDTVAFSERNKKAILASLSELAKDLGEPGACSVIAGFNCLKPLELCADDIADALIFGKSDYYYEIYNALAWYALEEVARAVVDYYENN
jgi:hypothetical protein